ncbi:MAG TPA: amino acid adenylation domain-containing protein, partial [Pseudonocardiaceae bacterium]
LVALLGVLRAGGAYVPLDDSVPPARLRAMAEDAGVRDVVVLPGSVCRVRRLRNRFDLDPAGAAPADVPPPVPVTGGDCAYVMFTSGSTGRPKPVAVPHRGVVRLAYSDLVAQRPRPGDRVLHGYGLSSDASTIEIWSALLGGACLVLVDRDELLSPMALRERIRDERVTVAYLTTGVFHHVARTRPEALRTLRFVSAGGEAMDPDLARAVLAACPDTTVVNFYGPTENTVVSTAHLVAGVPPGATSVPIGRPLEHVTCHVLHPDGALAGVGETGELYVGGEAVALGYLGDPELTADRFVDDPFTPGGRLYRTGDRARWRPDGDLEYRGRADRQVKLRGHRIELDGVEARLRACESVGEAVVDVVDGALVGFVTPAVPGVPVPVHDVRRDLASWLPAPAVPGRLVELAEFPVAAGGKVDRRRLLAGLASDGSPADVPDGNGPRDELADAPPLLRALAEVWHTVLRVRPRPTDGFFELGGDSLLAAEVVNRTIAVLGLDARHGSALVRGLLREPTLDGFGEAVAALGTTATATSAPRGRDFLADAALGFEPPPPLGPPPDWRRPRAVLLTGASGFVGAFLLDRLLRRTGAVVHCPVRARDDAHARRRVFDNLARYGITVADEDRVVCLAADVAVPDLALTADRVADLAGRLDLILHSAARANFLYPYQALRPANVEGTRELLRLAAPRRVPLHFLSTIAVVAGFGSAGVRHVDEDLPLAYPEHLTMGYAESKWVAEQLLRNASAAGLPVTVHRPYEITGDRRTGACNTETAICSLFKMIAETGLAPDIPLPMDFVPVDHVADVITHLATTVPAIGRTYHLTNPNPSSLATVLDRMRAAGHEIAELPYDAWVTELVRHVAEHPASATAPFVSLCVDRGNHADMSVKEMYFEGTFPTLGRANLERDLAGSGLVCPPVDAGLLDHYLEFFHSSGYLRRPERRRA